MQTAVAAEAAPAASVHRPKTPKTRTVFVQTDYRENDTQTDPWTPDYVVRPGTAPEVLTLASLSIGQVRQRGKKEKSNKKEGGREEGRRKNKNEKSKK